jgi:hypothetical protein
MAWGRKDGAGGGEENVSPRFLAVIVHRSATGLLSLHAGAVTQSDMSCRRFGQNFCLDRARGGAPPRGWRGDAKRISCAITMRSRLSIAPQGVMCICYAQMLSALLMFVLITLLVMVTLAHGHSILADALPIALSNSGRCSFSPLRLLARRHSLMKKSFCGHTTTRRPSASSWHR